MVPYFFKFDNKLLTSTEEDKITEIGIKNLNNFIQYKGKSSNNYDGNCLYFKTLMLYSEIRNLVSKFSIPCRPMIVMHHPGVEVIKHTDDLGHHRHCVLINPLLPKKDYVPTLFWENETVIATCEFTDSLPALINTQAFHSLQNNNNLRLNFQLCFDIDFSEVLDLHREGKLLK